MVRSATSGGKFYRLPPYKENTVLTIYLKVEFGLKWFQTSFLLAFESSRRLKVYNIYKKFYFTKDKCIATIVWLPAS